MRHARASAAAPGVTPARFMPTSTSTTTPRSTPRACAAWPSAATFASLSTATLTSAWRRRSASRSILDGPATWLAIRISPMPAAAIVSASLSVAQVTPSAPAARALWARAGTRMPLTCGRQPTPALPEDPLPSVRDVLLQPDPGPPTAQACPAPARLPSPVVTKRRSARNELLLIGLLRGAIVFLSDLMRCITIIRCASTLSVSPATGPAPRVAPCGW
jgi:hypothetical protein